MTSTFKLVSLFVLVSVVAACGGNGDSGGGVSLPAPATDTLPAPGSSASPTSGPESRIVDGKFQLSWDAVSGASSYAVARCALPDDSPTVNPCLNSPVDSCTVVGITQTPIYTTAAPDTTAACYRVKACSDAGGANCGFYGEPKFAAVVGVPFPKAFINSPIRTYSGQETVIHGYARNVAGAVTYEWKTPPGLTLCAGKSKTEQDLCFIAPTVTANQLLEFEFSAFGNGTFAVKAKTAFNVEPAGNVIVTTQDSRIIQPGQTVSLHPVGAGGTNYQWEQIGPVNPATGQIAAGMTVTLTNPDTANPTFVAPAGVDAGQKLQFKVTHSDAKSGKKTSQVVSIGGQAPSQITDGTPLKTAQSGTLGATQTPIVPQKLRVIAPPPAEVVSGMPVSLVMTAVHGNASQPYTWSWVKTAGPAVSLTGTNASILRFTAPAVSAATQLIFEATATDASGASKSGVAKVNVIPVPATAPPPSAPPQLSVQAPTIVAAGNTGTLTTQLVAPKLTQISGPPLITQLEPKPTGGTDVKVTTPTNLNGAATATFAIEGTNAQGVPTLEKHTVQIPPLHSQGTPLKVVESTATAGASFSIGTELRSAQIRQTAGTTVTFTTVPKASGGADFVTQGTGTKAGDQLSLEVTGTPAGGQPDRELHKVLIVPANGDAIKQEAPRVVTGKLPGQPVQLGTSLTNAQVLQTGGYHADIAVTANPDGTSTITVTPSAGGSGGSSSHTVELTILGRNSAGQVTKEVIHIDVLPPPVATPLKVPPLMVPTPAKMILPPQTTPTIQVAATSSGSVRSQAGQGEDVVLGVSAVNGSGEYTYQWTLVVTQPPIDKSLIMLQGADTANPRFKAPALTQSKVDLGFQVVITDKNSPTNRQTRLIRHTIYSTAAGSDPGAVAQVVEVAPGATVTLHAPAPFGGTPPYSVQLDRIVDSKGNVVVPGPVNLDTTKGVYAFTPPTPAAGASETYTATFTQTDKDGVQQTDTTDVKIAAPSPAGATASGSEPAPILPPAVASEPTLSASISVGYERDAAGQAQNNANTAAAAWTQVALTAHGNYTGKAHAGNTIRFINWSLTCPEALKDRDATAPINAAATSATCPDATERFLTASSAGAKVTGDGSAILIDPLPYIDPPKSATATRKALTLKVTVVEEGTLSDGTTPLRRLAKATSTVRLDSPLQGSQCYTCGDYDADPKNECTRIQIITRHEETCANETPYCMNDIFQAGDGSPPKLFKRCVSASEARDLWFMQSSDKVACFQYDSFNRNELVCHLACYGDHCNANALPPKETLWAP